MYGPVSSRRLRLSLRNRWVQGTLALAVVAALAVGAASMVRGTHASPPTVCPSGCAFTSISAAVAAAAANATITVGAGTYGPATGDSQIILTQGVTLQGIGGPVLDETTVDEAQGAICTDCGGSPTAPAAGGITIEGFIIKGGGGTTATPNFHQQIFLKGLSASNPVHITSNTFENPSDANSGTDGLTSVYVLSSTGAATTISNNTFNGVWQGVLLEQSTGASTISGNTFTGLVPSDPNGHADNGQAVHVSIYGTLTEAATTISNNIFTNYGGNAITTNSGHSSLGQGTLQGVTITGNSFDMGVPTHADSVLDLGSPASPNDGPTTSLTVSNNTFSLQGAVAGINLHGNIVSGTISNNVLRNGSSVAVLGVLVSGMDASTTLSITGNLIDGFGAVGLITDALANTTGVSASQNCIYGNATGASTTTGGNALTATNNWWGATNGPLPGGTGNAVTGNVTFSPFRTTAAAICAPVTSLSLGAPSAVVGGSTDVSTSTPINLSSVVAPATNSTIAHVFYRFYPQSGTPPAFTSVAGHTASFTLSGADGTYTVQDYAVDAAGNVEATHTTTLVLTALVPGLDVAGTSGSAPNTGSPDTGYQAPASTGNTNTATGNTTGTSQTASHPGTAASKPARISAVPWWAYAGAGSLLLLVVVGGVSFLLLRSRKSGQQA